MQAPRPIFVACFVPWLVVAAAPAQDLPTFRRLPVVARGTTVQLTIAAPVAKVAAGAPIRLEASLTPSAAWNGRAGVVWERRIAANQWQAWVDKSPGDNYPFEVAAGTTTWLTPRAQSTLLYAMEPGVWRASFCAHWHDDASAQQAQSPWCEFEVVPHPGNQQLLDKAKNLPMLSSGAMVWSWAIAGSRLGEDLPPIDPALLAKVGGRGMLPAGTPMADMAKELAGLRAKGVSLDLAVAAELVLVAREVERCRNLPAGPARIAAAAAIRKTLAALALDCPPAATPLAGQHGDVMLTTFHLLRSEDPPAATQLRNAVRARWPALADQMPAVEVGR